MKYVEPAELASWLRSGSKLPVIIDVRDADFPYGNIKGCHNIPSAKFHGEVEVGWFDLRSFKTPLIFQ